MTHSLLPNRPPGQKSLLAQLAEEAVTVAALPDSDEVLRAVVKRLQRWRENKAEQTLRSQTVPTSKVLFVRRKKGRIWHYDHIPENLWNDVQSMVAKYNATPPAERKEEAWDILFAEFSKKSRSYLGEFMVECGWFFGLWNEEYLFSLTPPTPGTICLSCLQGTPFVGCRGDDYMPQGDLYDFEPLPCTPQEEAERYGFLPSA